MSIESIESKLKFCLLY